MKPKEIEMDEQSLISVLKDMLEQDIKTQQFMETQKDELQKRDLKIEQLVLQIENIRVEAPKPDLSEMVAAIDSGYQNIVSAIEKRPKPIQRSWRILLFPETNAREYYRIVFSRFFFWGLIFTIVIYVASFINKSIDAYQAHQYNKDGNICISAWYDLYRQSGKAQRKEMDKALKRAAKENE
ncbi:hypothetical protein SAMN05216464_106158 [Mucilaginibacter pineti]|uniref:Uncharacterized protein n=1 Tax=Mucilaginibacter pineti TaxID=1391627 RepID=A0A1G7CYM4_9SPHI|nr:hypothetical protein [Mucilaginibacter pineti]SDE44432.1 hypothetical protein SAMN05216464_106158 [Mucilaginibacter pineti]